MQMIRVVGSNLVATAVRIVCQVLTTKIIAIMIGPSGLVIVGQIQNLISILGTVASMGINGGVVKLTAERPDGAERVWSTALALATAIAGVLMIAAIAMSRTLSTALMGDPGFAPVIMLIAGANVVTVIQALLFHILTGLKAYRRYVIGSICNSFLLLGLVALAASLGGGGLILGAMALSQASQIVGAVLVSRGVARIRLRAFLAGIDPACLRALWPFVWIGLATALTLPISQMAVRANLIEATGAAFAGIWEAAFKLSALYVSVLGAALGVYVLPTFSSLGDRSALRAEFVRVVAVLLGVLILGAAAQYLLRDVIIRGVYTAQFLPASELYAIHIPGDIARGLTFVVIMLATSRAMSGAVVIANLVFALAFVGLSLLWIPIAGGEGAARAYVVASVGGLVTSLALVWRRLW